MSTRTTAKFLVDLLILLVRPHMCITLHSSYSFIGSYTFAKTLEYKAKHNLITTKGKETTVIPPTEYQRRFLIALENYFLICPGL